jgi:predicted RNA-binding protein with PIN domain
MPPGPPPRWRRYDMQIIIDGYNLIFAMRAARQDESRFDPSYEREKLLETLTRYRKRNPV